MSKENDLWTQEEADELLNMLEATNFIIENGGLNFWDGDKFQFSLDDKHRAWMHLMCLMNVQNEALSVLLKRKEVTWQ
jgi:hypothetical protein